jgi:hypothetical protein
MKKEQRSGKKKGHKQYECEICTKPRYRYAQEENLKKHYRVFHRGGKEENES